MIRTRDVEQALYKNHLRKAEELINAAQRDITDKKWNVGVINAVHTGICAADALTVRHLGKRCAEQKHHDVIRLIKTIRNIEYDTKKTQQLSSLLSIKNKAEYEEELMTEQEATLALKHAERFLEWVKSQI